MAEPTPPPLSPTLEQRPEMLQPGGSRPTDPAAEAAAYEDGAGLLSATASTVPGYEILGELGRGGMGVVYKARQVKLNRIVALKMILHGMHSGQQERARFLAEAEAVAKLQHPNIVQVHDVGEIDGQPFFSMEYVDGGSLSEQIRGKPLAPRAAAELLQTLARAVEAAHQRGIVHRDLKPANVLLQKDEGGRMKDESKAPTPSDSSFILPPSSFLPKITDFGLAKQLGNQSGQTQSGTVLGTPSYMAPEQAAGRTKDIGPAADVYSLGAILYEMLTGRPPFQGETTTETLLLVLDSEPQRPRAFNRLLDASLEAICLKCLEKLPQDRYAGAAALAEDLEAYLKGEAVLADRSSNLRLMRLLLRESRHAEVLAQYGHVWMWQAGVIFIGVLIAESMMRLGVLAMWPYALTTLAMAAGCIQSMWYFRLRGGKPLIPLERQMGLLFAVTVSGMVLTATINFLKGMQPLEMLPVVLVETGMFMGCLGVLLGGSFYVGAVASGVGAVVLALKPDLGPLVFAIVMGVGLFVPGWRFSRHVQRPPGE